jgi:hypothetical protein
VTICPANAETFAQCFAHNFSTTAGSVYPVVTVYLAMRLGKFWWRWLWTD